MTKTWCLRGRHYSNTNKILQYEKLNPQTHKVVKNIYDTCSICSRIKSQIFTE